MAHLAEWQRRVRNAVVAADASSAAELFTGGPRAVRRLAIHVRHYEASLVRVLMGRFPATAWFVGSQIVEQAAGRFAHARPPRSPCMAEYGEAFPAFLAGHAGPSCPACLEELSSLEWRLGQLALAVDRPALGRRDLSARSGEDLADAVFTVQPGLAYLRAAWPIDDLLSVFLAGTEPPARTLAPADVRLELRGVRGALALSRLDAGDFAFRAAVAGGRALGAAAEEALNADPSFDPGRALSSLLDAGLVTAVDWGDAART